MAVLVITCEPLVWYDESLEAKVHKVESKHKGEEATAATAPFPSLPLTAVAAVAAVPATAEAAVADRFHPLANHLTFTIFKFLGTCVKNFNYFQQNHKHCYGTATAAAAAAAAAATAGRDVT